MTTKKQDDQAMAEDQAFIQSLYDDLSLEKTDNINDGEMDHPSVALDRRILDAAHKAVADNSALQQNDTIDTKNKPKNDNVKTLPIPTKTGKKIPWYFSVATAASVLLMVTVVNNQLSAPNNPIFDSPSISVDSMINSKQNDTSKQLEALESSELVMAENRLNKSTSAFADSQFVEIESEEVLAFEKENAVSSPTIEQDAVNSTSARQLFLANKQAVEAESQLSKNIASAKREKRAIEEKQAKQSLSTKKAQAILIEDNQLSTQKLSAHLTAVNLSNEKYKILQAESHLSPIYWSLQQETESSYIIELLTTEQASVFYRLNKNNYQLNDTMINEKHEFSKIINLSKKVNIY